MEERGRSSDSGLPPPRPSRPLGQWHFRGGTSPLTAAGPSRTHTGFPHRAPFEAEPIIGLVPSSLAVRLWLPVLLWAAVIFAFSSVPDLGTGLGTWDLVLRKLAHATEYAVLGALLLRAVRDELPALALGVAYAASDEVHQHFVEGRHAAPLDVLIDAVGVTLGVVVWRRAGR
jgi:VanZ family protein